jgi:hypothetical protein
LAGTTTAPLSSRSTEATNAQSVALDLIARLNGVVQENVRQALEEEVRRVWKGDDDMEKV